MINIFKKFIFILLAIILFIYILICDVLMTFSLSMNTVFEVACISLLLMHYIANNPINLELRGPSFVRVFVQTASLFFYAGIILLLLFNLLYPKNRLDETSGGYDYIIVFGAGISENKTDIINSRIEKAVEYSKNFKHCKFVLTGAKGVNEPIEEAIYMKNYMVDRGISEKRIIIDPFSINTSENVSNSLRLIKNDVIKRNARENIIPRPFKNTDNNYDLDFLNIGFMSSEFHLTRINMMAKKLGIYKPYDIDCETDIIYLPYQYIREDLSLFKALVLNQLRI